MIIGKDHFLVTSGYKLLGIITMSQEEPPLDIVINGVIGWMNARLPPINPCSLK